MADITHLPVGTGWAYLPVLIDSYRRKVDRMRREPCLEALQRALAACQPSAGLVHHSDRGSQYTSAESGTALDEACIVQGLNREGNCWDNPVAGYVFGTLEQELGTSARWTRVGHARTDVGGWILGFSNDQRLHSTIGLHGPVELEALHRASITEAA